MSFDSDESFYARKSYDAGRRSAEAEITSLRKKLKTARRDATVAALEALPCEGAMRTGWICLGAVDPRCPRCRALAVARKGGQG